MFDSNNRSSFLQNIFEGDKKLMENMEKTMMRSMREFDNFTKELANKMSQSNTKDKNFSSTKMAINVITEDENLRNELMKKMEKISGMKITKNKNEIVGLLEKENGKAVDINYSDPFFKGLANNAMKQIDNK